MSQLPRSLPCLAPLQQCVGTRNLCEATVEQKIRYAGLFLYTLASDM